MKKLLAILLSLALMMGAASFALAEEPVTVTVMFHGSNVTDDTAVLEKLNEYLTEKIGVKLDVVWGTWGDFDEKSVNSILGGDDIDMYFTCSWSADEYNNFARKGYWLKLDELIDQYAPELKTALPQALMSAATINGSDGVGIYAVNGYKDFATQNCWDVNVTLLEELGYTLDDVKKLDYFTFGDLLAKAKQVKGADFYPLVIEPMVLERMVCNSVIIPGDSGATNLLSYYLNPQDVSKSGAYGTKLINKFATDEYRAFVEKTREYYLAGYIDPALAVAETSNDTRQSAQLKGAYLIGTQSYALGYEYTASQERKIHVEFVPCTEAYVDTTASQGAMIAISSASAHPVESMKFLNLLNTDPYVMTMLNYGVEGIHYTLSADGLIQFTDKRNDYQPWRNGMGNITLLPPTVDEGAGFWDTFKAYYGAAQALPILGFVFDASKVEGEMAALSNVAAQYALALDAGAVDPATALPEFLNKLDEAGINTYLTQANEQLAAFLGGK